MYIPTDITQPKYRNIRDKEIADAVDDLDRLQNVVNTTGNQIADIEDRLEESIKESAAHEEKFRWLTGNALGERPMFFFAWALALALPLAEILIVGIQSTGSLLIASELPLLLSFIHIGLLMYVIRLRITLTKNEWPLPPLPDEDQRLSFKNLRRYPVLTRSKWLVVLILAGWAFMVLVMADIELVKYENELAHTDAIMNGTVPVLQEIPGIIEAALHNPVIFLYTFLVFLGNALVALFDWHLYAGFMYRVGYMPIHKSLKKTRAGLKNGLRDLLQDLYTAFSHYRAKKREYERRYSPFNPPDETFSHRTRKYIDDQHGGSDEADDPGVAGVPEPVIFDPPSGDGHMNEATQSL
ncbi:MAG: hypothetical protein AAF564_02785 [Bacteroidota bacterium]